MTINTVKSDVGRDRYGRPLIIPEGGGKPVPYQRWSSYGDVLEDRHNLEKWKVRMAALGIADRADLLLAVAAHRDDKQKLNAICDQAIEAAKASAAATTGTALHSLSELVDTGRDLPVLPESARADLEAYRAAMRQVEVVAIEQFVVCDEIPAAGTFDRIVKVGNTRFIADIKTGSIEWGIGKIAVQLAGYSRSVGYDIATGARTPLNVDQNNALIIHLPQGEATCQLVWVNVARGWEGVQMAAEVRRWRAAERKGLTAPFVPQAAA
jgi:hypothetical protein